MKENIQDFLKFLEVDKKYAENTVAAYQNDLNQFYEGVDAGQDGQGPQNWADVTKAEISTYIEQLKNSGYTSSTVARKVAAIKSFFHFLLATSIITDDPTFSLDSPKVKKRLPKAISPAEIERILRAPLDEIGPKSQRDLALLEMLYASGMRVTELVSLNVSDLTFEKGSPASGSVRVRGKRASKDRTIPLNSSVVNTLQAYIQGARATLIHNPKEDALFLNNRGQRLTRQGLWLIIKRYVEIVGIDGPVTPHTLRHSFAAHKLSQGKSLQDIQKLLGHANISTTQVYAQLNKETGDQ